MVWAIEEAAKVNDDEAKKGSFNGVKFFDFMQAHEQQWSICLEFDNCTDIVNEANDNPIDSGLGNINFAQEYLKISSLEATPKMSAKDWVYGIRALLKAGLELFEAQETGVFMWNGMDATKYNRFLFKYANYIDTQLKMGKLKTLAKFFTKFQNQFMVEGKEISQDEMEERLSFMVNTSNLLKQPCDSLSKVKDSINGFIKWAPLAKGMDKIKVNLSLCDVKLTEEIASLDI